MPVCYFMKAALIQYSPVWEEKEASLARLSSLLDEAADSDLVVLPEMFSTGFTMNPEPLAETMKGSTVAWMKRRAEEGGYALCGTVIIKDEAGYRNRMIMVEPDGKTSHYDKRHLHSISGEDNVYVHGNRRVIVPYMKFNFNLQVCYDLRFPVWSRNRGDTDVIIYSANWPAVRSDIWKALLVARAIENQAYVIGVNRTGSRPDGTTYSGDSMIVGPRGEIMAEAGREIESVVSASLSVEELTKYRNEMPVWRDADRFELS